MIISREIVASRRPFKTPAFIAGSGVVNERSRIKDPNRQTATRPRRDFKRLVFVGDNDRADPAVAGVTAAGVVTVYNLSGSVRWSRTILGSSSSQHDICFDAVGGIWARGGDGLQLVHTDRFGNILTDTAIGSIYNQGVPQAIDFSPAGLAYSNQNSPSVDPPHEIAQGPTGALLTPLNFHASARHVGITNAGVVVGWDQTRYCVWNGAGSLIYNGGLTSIAIIPSPQGIGAVSPTGDFFHFFCFDGFTGTVQRGNVNLATGVLSASGDTLLSDVTWATCSSTGTLTYGTLPPSGGTQATKAVAKTSAVAYACGNRLEWTWAGGNMIKLDFSVSCTAFDG